MQHGLRNISPSIERGDRMCMTAEFRMLSNIQTSDEYITGICLVAVGNESSSLCIGVPVKSVSSKYSSSDVEF